MHTLLHGLARKEGQLLIVIRDFESNAQNFQSQFKKLGYYWAQMIPNTYMDIPWKSPEDYLNSMKSYYRSKLRKHLAINQAQGIRHELTSEFHHLAEQLCRQWLVVHHQADEFAREKLTPEFYHELSHQMGERSKALLNYKGDELVGHALLLQDGELLRWLYFGRETAVNDSLYIYVGWSVVHSAILLGAKQLELGLTTYPIKQDLGAQLEPIHIALRGTSNFINTFVGWFYPLLNRVPPIRNRNVFKTGIRN
ncbi:GNAT family N-acetyltransferase [Ferrovum myxofaciens]|uniref:GNAT family N-acetyltransferase n=1 Tax=Ferrovum myxofaciens TaxID=416213 RepID=UPI00222850C1|nr:GNAT family N-acetyltransferase [Ferrovum myxofaciens]